MNEKSGEKHPYFNVTFCSTCERIDDECQHFIQRQGFGKGAARYCSLVLKVHLQIEDSAIQVMFNIMPQSASGDEEMNVHLVIKERLHKGLCGTGRSTRFTLIRSDRIK
jgi:hypothetical protein